MNIIPIPTDEDLKRWRRIAETHSGGLLLEQPKIIGLLAFVDDLQCAKNTLSECLDGVVAALGAKQYESVIDVATRQRAEIKLLRDVLTECRDFIPGWEVQNPLRLKIEAALASTGGK